MHLQSLFPPVRNVSSTNYHHVVFPEGLSEGQIDADNYTIHIDVITGRRRSVREFTRDVYDAITALGMGKSNGGLKLESQKHRVGILSDNCMVCRLRFILAIHSSNNHVRKGLYHNRTRSDWSGRSICTLITFRNPMGAIILSKKGGRDTRASP